MLYETWDSHHDVLDLRLHRPYRQEALAGPGIGVENRLMKHRLVAHRVEHAVEKGEEFFAPLGADVEFDELDDGHDWAGPFAAWEGAPILPAAGVDDPAGQVEG